MTTQIELLTVPVCRTRLEIWKELHSVVTFHRPEKPWEEEDPQWIAAFSAVYEHIGYDVVFMDIDIVFHAVAQDGGDVFHGDTEEDACAALAEAWTLQFLNGITPAPAQAIGQPE